MLTYTIVQYLFVIIMKNVDIYLFKVFFSPNSNKQSGPALFQAPCTSATKLMKLLEDINSCPANFQQWCCYNDDPLCDKACDCIASKSCHRTCFVIVNVLIFQSFTSYSQSIMIPSFREVKWVQLSQKASDHMGPLAKMYHSVVSWIIEQQNCNFRDQCSMPILFSGSK